MRFSIRASRQKDWEAKQKVEGENFLGVEDGFFTRDDCIEYIEIPLEELIRENYDFQADEPVNLRCYIEDGNNLDVDVEVDGCFFNLKLDKPIDMRRIRVPSDLKKYVSELFDKFSEEYRECMIDYGEEVEGCDISAASSFDDSGWEFKPVPLKSLKKGTWFTIKPIAEPTDKQVYIKDDYDREEKKFMCGRCDDISYSTYFKGDKLVYTDFVY